MGSTYFDILLFLKRNNQFFKLDFLTELEKGNALTFCELIFVLLSSSSFKSVYSYFQSKGYDILLLNKKDTKAISMLWNIYILENKGTQLGIVLDDLLNPYYLETENKLEFLLNYLKFLELKESSLNKSCSKSPKACDIPFYNKGNGAYGTESGSSRKTLSKSQAFTQQYFDE